MLRRNQLVALTALAWAFGTCHAFVHPIIRTYERAGNSLLAKKTVVETTSSTDLPDVTVNGETPKGEEVVPDLVVNGQAPKGEKVENSFEEWVNVDEEVENQDLLIPFAPPLSFDKFITMQEKRVVVTVRYSQGLKPFYLTVARRIKEAHPDVMMEKLILPNLDDGDGPTFEVLVDGKVVLPRGRSKKQADQEGASIFVSMYELDLAIAKARRRRRPSTVYGDDNTAVKVHMFRKVEDYTGGPPNKWND